MRPPAMWGVLAAAAALLSGCAAIQTGHLRAAERACAAQYPLARGTAAAFEECVGAAEQRIYRGTYPLATYDQSLRAAEGEAIDAGDASPAAAELARQTALIRAYDALTVAQAQRAQAEQEWLGVGAYGLHLMGQR